MLCVKALVQVTGMSFGIYLRCSFNFQGGGGWTYIVPLLVMVMVKVGNIGDN